MQTYKYKGEVHKVLPLQTFQSGFAKRTLVLKDDSGQYTDYAAFDFTRSKDGSRDGTKQLDRIRPGETVEVTFTLSANESKMKPGSWFPSNRASKVERVGAEKVVIPTKDDIPVIDAADEEEMPF